MIITAEISYYPLTTDFSAPIDLFISKLSAANITVEYGKTSTVLVGEYLAVMELLTKSMNDLMNDYPSIFNVKISNTCPI